MNDICMTVVLYGASGSGKSTVANELQKLGFDRIRQITTRKPRIFPGDYPGIVIDEKRLNEYDFMGEAAFLRLFDEGVLAEYNSFDKMEDGELHTVWYGSYIWKFNEPGFHVITTNIEGAGQIASCEEITGDLLFVEMVKGRAKILGNAARRKRDSLEEIVRRSMSEFNLYYKPNRHEKFCGKGFKPDLIFDDTVMSGYLKLEGYEEGWIHDGSCFSNGKGNDFVLYSSDSEDVAEDILMAVVRKLELKEENNGREV